MIRAEGPVAGSFSRTGEGRGEGATSPVIAQPLAWSSAAADSSTSPCTRGEGCAPRPARGVLTLLILAWLTPARAEPSLSILPLPFPVREFRGPASRVAALAPTTDGLRGRAGLAGGALVVVWGEGGGAALSLAGADVAIAPFGRGAGDLVAIERGRDAIPDARTASAGPLAATLVDPTGDYAHEALGSAVHAKTLLVTERRPVQPGPDPKPVPMDRTRVPAGPGAVFEDREPRLVDLDRDGVPEIVTVRSSLERGSSLAVIARRGGVWSIVAETPPIGEPRRWLNPAAVADFRGTGRPDIALVRTPHAEGVLQLWSFSDGRLSLLAEAPGYSNHAFGQTAQSLAAAVDLAGTGRSELALPTLDRRAIAVLGIVGGAWSERWRVALPARAATGVAALGSGAGTHILVGLEDGRVADIRP